MANSKTGFIFYFDNYPALLTLPLEQRGLVITLLCLYADRVWRDPEYSLEEALELFPQLSEQAAVACRFMGAAILRDTRRWLEQREYRMQRRQSQQDPSGRQAGRFPDSGQATALEKAREYNRQLRKMVEIARNC